MPIANQEQVSEITAALGSPRRILVAAPSSTNILAFLTKTLRSMKVELSVVSLNGVRSSKELGRAFAQGDDSMGAALTKLNLRAEERSVALIVDRFDSLRKSDDETYYVAQVRLELERIDGRSRRFPVYLTATDVDFVSRVVGPPRRDTALQLILLDGWNGSKAKHD